MLHELWLYHSDIKPENIVFRKLILLINEFIPVLIDFGGASFTYKTVKIITKIYFLNASTRLHQD